MSNATPTYDILTGDVFAVLPTLPEKSVHMVCTSPPYWGLRDYGTAQWAGGDPACDHSEIIDTQRTLWANTAHGPHGQNKNGGASQKVKTTGGVCVRCGAQRVDRQLGLEAVPDCLGWATDQPCGECYVCRMVAVFEQVRRVLREDGVLFLNLGDTYASNWPCQRRNIVGNGALPNGKRAARPPRLGPFLKDKDMVGIPWRVALALQAAGWYLRSEIIWHKLNAMPESVQDRPTKAHEQIFLLTKSPRYFYDAEAIKEPTAGTAHPRGNGIHPKALLSETANRPPSQRTPSGWDTAKGTHNRLTGRYHPKQNASYASAITEIVALRNCRDVWLLSSEPYREAHFATFPPALVRRCILAGASAAGCCSACGAPYKRIRTTVDRSTWNGSRFDDGKNLTVHPNVSRREETPTNAAPKNGHEYVNTTQTTGWTPTCTCNVGAPIPCTCLDPFAGSGTTLAVALSLGRSSIGIELNPAYVQLAERRLAGVTPPLPNLATEIPEDDPA